MEDEKMPKTTYRISRLLFGMGAIAASTITLGIIAFIPSTSTFVNSYELSNGQTVFLKSPHLIRAAATDSSTGARSNYQFTIEVPKNAGASLKAVTIVQKNSPERIKFDVSESKAFIGDSFAGGPTLALTSIGGEQPSEENSVTVAFDRPVEPGTTVTVSLRALHNPQFGGVYQFGVTAYPVGENSQGLYLGSASLHFLRH
jgi:hypothetical protein